MILQVHQQAFFHQTTEWLPSGFLVASFPTGNPARNTLASDFEQIDATNSVLRHGKLLASMNFHLYRTVYSRYKLIGQSIRGSVPFLISNSEYWVRFVRRFTQFTRSNIEKML